MNSASISEEKESVVTVANMTDSYDDDEGGGGGANDGGHRPVMVLA